ncbi:exopolysaccharide biosynthesis protein [Roseovarius spongiae]|uniref:Exopolysaccharide biosynthesis protein n=1 Tax=Roseovarius spongiae TaxID=2320272 RepID=A0A3A8AU65_9RHOB|nr:CpsD/CapB family tyrosine-protein kinase [Roseovarius spongiae]RKF12389.1 exopolysaccharide biosynthesis protein [Roseovarius spongiae]
MERIQEALAKARAQRQQGSATRTQHAAPPPANQSLEEAWASLAPFRLNRAELRRTRVVAAESGRDAAPYDLLRTKIIHQSQVNEWKRIAIVSPDSGAGKTTTLANLAFSFERQRDMRVICLDLDLRRPALQKILAQKPDHSMAEILEGHVRFAEHGLRLGERVGFGLNNGPAPNPSELLLSHAARDALDGIEREYAPDLTFFDLSPLNASDDNIAFLQNVDCAVIIAEAESTSMSRIDQAERQVAELTNVMGIVLNKSRYASEAEGYDYY